MNYNVLKDSIAAVIKANGNEEITGDLLQQVLLSMVNILGTGYQFMGAAVPTTNPGTPDAREFYIATQAGTYTNFGSPAIELDGTQIAVLLFASSWTSVVLSVPTKEYVDTALALKVDKVEGKGLSTNDLTDALVALIGGAFQKEDIEQELGDSTTKVVSQAAITAVLLQYAKVDGYYSQLTAGAAENLVGRGSVPASFLRRTTGGTADVGTGSAKIAKLMGNSIVWNQLVPLNPSIGRDGLAGEITFTNNNDGSYTLNGTATAKRNVVIYQVANVGHTMLYTLDKAVPGISLGDGYTSASSGSRSYLKQSAQTGGLYIDIANGTVLDNVVIRPNTRDLTKMFGAGKEPTTVAEFEALFPLPYYAYEPGKVLPFAAQKLVTTGFNQFNPATGIAKLLGGNKYQLTGTYTAATIDGVAVILDSENCFTPNADCELVITGGNETDTCVHLVWSGYRNGEYEPYELHEAIFDPANWEDANGNKIFPYGGMHGVGTARDFATPDIDGFIRKGTRVFGRVDLGSLNWAYYKSYFYAVLNGRKDFGIGICSNFTNGANGDPDTILNDKEFNFTNNAASNGVNIKDSTYGTDAAAFKAAMSGVYLYYELATPVETELAEPVGASYYANDFGTEEWTPANTDEPYTAPCDLAIAYAMNAVDTLRRLPENYISTGSFENFCSELATKLGAALNKTITITPTYDSENAEYNYAITIADIEE